MQAVDVAVGHALAGCADAIATTRPESAAARTAEGSAADQCNRQPIVVGQKWRREPSRPLELVPVVATSQPESAAAVGRPLLVLRHVHASTASPSGRRHHRTDTPHIPYLLPP